MRSRFGILKTHCRCGTYFSTIHITIRRTPPPASDDKTDKNGDSCMNKLIFNFAIAIRTYFQKVGDPRDITPSMAVGFTINHIAAVFLPAIGGMLWIVDYRIPFIGGAAMSLVSFFAVQGIRVSVKKNIE